MVIVHINKDISNTIRKSNAAPTTAIAFPSVMLSNNDDACHG